MARSSCLSGTTLPWAVVLDWCWPYWAWRKALAGDCWYAVGGGGVVHGLPGGARQRLRPEGIRVQRRGGAASLMEPLGRGPHARVGALGRHSHRVEPRRDGLLGIAAHLLLLQIPNLGRGRRASRHGPHGLVVIAVGDIAHAAVGTVHRPRSRRYDISIASAAASWRPRPGRGLPLHRGHGGQPALVIAELLLVVLLRLLLLLLRRRRRRLLRLLHHVGRGDGRGQGLGTAGGRSGAEDVGEGGISLRIGRVVAVVERPGRRPAVWLVVVGHGWMLRTRHCYQSARCWEKLVCWPESGGRSTYPCCERPEIDNSQLQISGTQTLRDGAASPENGGGRQRHRRAGGELRERATGSERGGGRGRESRGGLLFPDGPA